MLSVPLNTVDTHAAARRGAARRRVASAVLAQPRTERGARRVASSSVAAHEAPGRPRATPGRSGESAARPGLRARRPPPPGVSGAGQCAEAWPPCPGAARTGGRARRCTRARRARPRASGRAAERVLDLVLALAPFSVAKTSRSLKRKKRCGGLAPRPTHAPPSRKRRGGATSATRDAPWSSFSKTSCRRERVGVVDRAAHPPSVCGASRVAPATTRPRAPRGARPPPRRRAARAVRAPPRLADGERPRRRGRRVLDGSPKKSGYLSSSCTA